MTSTEIIVIVGGLLLGYWIVASLFNKKPVSSTTNSNNSSKDEPQENRSHAEEPDHNNSGEEEYIPTSWFRIGVRGRWRGSVCRPGTRVLDSRACDMAVTRDTRLKSRGRRRDPSGRSAQPGARRSRATEGCRGTA